MCIRMSKCIAVNVCQDVKVHCRECVSGRENALLCMCLRTRKRIAVHVYQDVKMHCCACVSGRENALL
jgi:hypothetical protein